MPHHGVFVRDQAGAISKNHSVIVISSKVDYTSFKLFSWRLEESIFGNITEFRLVVAHSLPLLNQFNYLLISIWVAWKIARRFQPDIIHGNIAYPGGIWSYSVSRLISKPFIISDHTSKFTDNFRSAFHRVTTLFSMRRARKVIAVSTWAASRIEPYIRRPVDIVPNLIHVDEYSISTPSDNTVQIGFLGGLSTNRKGLDILLKALAEINKPYVMHIGGSGKHLDYYRKMAVDLGVYDKCRFHGFVDYVPDFMSKLHFFISSSRIEAFGMVIVEAMACGLPVVTANSGGPADYVDDSCGLMVETENVGQMAEAIDWMIDHHHSFDRQKIRKKAVDHYSPATFVRNIEEIYRKIR